MSSKQIASEFSTISEDNGKSYVGGYACIDLKEARVWNTETMKYKKVSFSDMGVVMSIEEAIEEAILRLSKTYSVDVDKVRTKLFDIVEDAAFECYGVYTKKRVQSIFDYAFPISESSYVDITNSTSGYVLFADFSADAFIELAIEYGITPKKNMDAASCLVILNNYSYVEDTFTDELIENIYSLVCSGYGIQIKEFLLS